MFQMSDHSEMRASQRRLSAEEIEYVTIFGKRFHTKGSVVYYLRRRDLPRPDRREDDWARLVGTAVVVACDSETVITVWRNRKKGLKRIRQKRD